jgi:hypothetical protein
MQIFLFTYKIKDIIHKYECLSPFHISSVREYCNNGIHGCQKDHVLVERNCFLCVRNALCFLPPSVRNRQFLLSCVEVHINMAI